MKWWSAAILGLPGIGVISVIALAIHSRPQSVSSFAEVQEHYRPSEAYLLDRNRRLLQVLRMDYTRRRLPWTRLTEISPALVRAVLQTEDRRFYLHHGVDLNALMGSGAAAGGGRRLRGASTLTMQLVTQLDPTLAPHGRHRSMLQKLRQMRMAWRLESTWSKEQILEAYLNLVSFRGELQGVRAAAGGLFDKVPGGLTEDESWIMAALLAAPGAAADQVAQRACNLEHTFKPQADCGPLMATASNAFADLDRMIVSAELAPQLAHHLLRRPGEQMVTTLDIRVQRVAVNALAAQLAGLTDRNVRDASAMVVDNASGDVLAYVGDVPTRGEMVDGVQAPRQAGSTLKPFLYGLALERRYLTAASLLDDSPVHIETGGGLYIPQDYDQAFHGLVSVRTALAGSLNVPAVRTLVLVGLDAFLERLRALGYVGLNEAADYYGFSLALGSGEVTLYQQVNAFRSLANGGRWSSLRMTPDQPVESPRAVMPAAPAFIISDILHDRGSRAVTFGLDSPLATPFWSAVKTGTSKFMRDNWCIGYTRRYTVGVWVGNFDGEAMRDVSGVSGAAPAWLEIMKALESDHHAEVPAPPEVVAKEVRFADALEGTRQEWFLRGTELVRVEPAPAPSLRPRLESPPAGMIVALDPDIPPNRQQILFRSQPERPSLQYELDGVALGRADHAMFWAPRPGSHLLRLIGPRGVILDQVAFKVRPPH